MNSRTVTALAVCAALVVGAIGGWAIARVQFDKKADAALTAAESGASKVESLTAQVERLQTEVDNRGRQIMEAKAQLRKLGVDTSTQTGVSVWGPGVYTVGKDIKPGVYKGTVTGGSGYWARLSAVDGSLESVIANGTPEGPFTLEVKSSDYAIELKDATLAAQAQ